MRKYSGIRSVARWSLAAGEWSVAKLESTVRLGEVMTPRTAASLC